MVLTTNKLNLPFFAWSLTCLVSVIAILGWGQYYQWNFANFTSYQLFPLFGLLAFSLMWSHYIVSALRQYLGFEKSVLRNYFEWSSYMVLLTLLLHPGLLILQLWRDGLGLPPTSYLKYVGPTMHISVIAGTISLVLFLMFEFRRLFEYRSWWKFVGMASDFAMVLILLHSLKLGTQLQFGRLRYLWYFYGISYFVAIFYIYLRKLQYRKSNG